MEESVLVGVVRGGRLVIDSMDAVDFDLKLGLCGDDEGVIWVGIGCLEGFTDGFCYRDRGGVISGQADFVKSSMFCNVSFSAVLARFLMLHTVLLVQRQWACLALPGDVGAAGF